MAVENGKPWLVTALGYPEGAMTNFDAAMAMMGGGEDAARRASEAAGARVEAALATWRSPGEVSGVDASPYSGNVVGIGVFPAP